MKKTLPLCALLCSLAVAHAADSAVAVLLGALDMREAKMVVQTNGAFEGALVCVPEGDTQARSVSIPFRTAAQGDFLAKLDVGPLAPGTRYAYSVAKADGAALAQGAFTTPANYKDRTPPPDFKVAFAGGHHDNDKDFDPPFKTPGGDYYIYKTLRAQEPSLMIWLGDTVALREGDWGSRSGVLARYRNARAGADIGALFANVPNLAVWGAGETADGDRFTTLLPLYRDIFRAHWANPTFGAPEIESSNAAQVRQNDVEFFLLDGRTFRDMGKTPFAEIYGEAQLKWLLEALTRSKATFKVVVTHESFLCPIDLKNQPVATAKERDLFLEAVKLRKIEGLIFVSGGKAFGETTKFVRANGYDLYDFCIGPATARPEEAPSTINYLKVPGSTTRGRQFAVLAFAGPEDARTATLTVYAPEGKPIYSHVLRRKELQ